MLLDADFSVAEVVGFQSFVCRSEDLLLFVAPCHPLWAPRCLVCSRACFGCVRVGVLAHIGALPAIRVGDVVVRDRIAHTVAARLSFCDIRAYRPMRLVQLLACGA